MQTYLAKEQLDDLVTLLTKARVVNRLLDFMPPSKRSLEDFSSHFRWGPWPQLARRALSCSQQHVRS